MELAQEPETTSIGVRHSLELSCDPRGPHDARAFVVATLAGTALADLAERVELLTSELVTNAVLHARTTVTVNVEVRADYVRVEVWDHHVDRTPRIRAAEPMDDGGRGLMVVARLSTDWGVQRTRSSKCVWFECRPEATAR